MFGAMSRPKRQTRDDRATSQVIYEAIEKGYRVEPRFIRELRAGILEKLKAAQTLGLSEMQEDLLEKLEAVEAYTNRGSQASILQKARDEKELAGLYAESELYELSAKAMDRHYKLMELWKHYHIRAPF
jgi:hypothetical protein